VPFSLLSCIDRHVPGFGFWHVLSLKKIPVAATHSTNKPMSEYVEYLKEVFREFGSVEPRRMFGGYGLFHKGLMFALVADDILYLKADEANSLHFTERELEQFSYEKQGRAFKMSYFMAPDDLFDDPEEAKIWAERSYAAAVRSKKPKKKK
jgi:DNA transformation protein